MKTSNNLTFIFFVLTFHFTFSQSTVSSVVAVSLPAVALLDIEPNGNISMIFTTPTEAGLALLAPAANTTKWINYTSAVTSSGAKRRITASVNQVIPGVDIKLQAGVASGTGGGMLGMPTPQITLTTIPVNIITGIGGAFTGNGPNNGHRLTINLVTNSYANLSTVTNKPVVITYTITE